jgi:hypothetical protein
VNGKEDMRGQKHSGEGLFFGGGDFGGGSIIWRLEDCIFLVLNLVDCYRGASVAGSFGLGGQESLRNPGAREPDRLLLAGWEVSRFWVEHQAELAEVASRQSWQHWQ